MQCSHALAAGMGGMRTAGDLVVRMQMTRGMRLEPAKQYVAERLGVAPSELGDPVVMNEVRRDRGLGRIPVQDATYPREPSGMEAKSNIAALLDVTINSIERQPSHPE
jgi:hypothetical protein